MLWIVMIWQTVIFDYMLDNYFSITMRNKLSKTFYSWSRCIKTCCLSLEAKDRACQTECRPLHMPGSRATYRLVVVMEVLHWLDALADGWKYCKRMLIGRQSIIRQQSTWYVVQFYEQAGRLAHPLSIGDNRYFRTRFAPAVASLKISK